MNSQISVAEYAALKKITVQAARYQCRKGILEKGYTAKQIGRTWIITKSNPEQNTK